MSQAKETESQRCRGKEVPVRSGSVGAWQEACAGAGAAGDALSALIGMSLPHRPSQ